MDVVPAHIINLLLECFKAPIIQTVKLDVKLSVLLDLNFIFLIYLRKLELEMV